MTLATAYRNKIDALWLDFHSGGITNPITVIEQISYLMFARLLVITESRNEKRAGRLKKDFKRLFPEDKQHTISPGEKTLLPFLLFYLRSEGVQGWIQKQEKGGTFSEITLGRLCELPLLIPPLSNQKRFAAAYEKLEKAKAAQQKQLLDSNTLFSSLQQRAFRGEL